MCSPNCVFNHSTFALPQLSLTTSGITAQTSFFYKLHGCELLYWARCQRTSTAPSSLWKEIGMSEILVSLTPHPVIKSMHKYSAHQLHNQFSMRKPMLLKDSLKVHDVPAPRNIAIYNIAFPGLRPSNRSRTPINTVIMLTSSCIFLFLVAKELKLSYIGILLELWLAFVFIHGVKHLQMLHCRPFTRIQAEYYYINCQAAQKRRNN